MKQQLEELKTAQEGYESLAVELNILKMEKNSIVQLKDAEIKELKTKLNDIQAENGKAAGKKSCKAAHI